MVTWYTNSLNSQLYYGKYLSDRVLRGGKWNTIFNCTYRVERTFLVFANSVSRTLSFREESAAGGSICFGTISCDGFNFPNSCSKCVNLLWRGSWSLAGILVGKLIRLPRLDNIFTISWNGKVITPKTSFTPDVINHTTPPRTPVLGPTANSRWQMAYG